MGVSRSKCWFHNQEGGLESRGVMRAVRERREEECKLRDLLYDNGHILHVT